MLYLSQNTLKFTEDEVSNIDIIGVYNLVAKRLNYNTEEEGILYDCRKIIISENIQTSIFDHYKITRNTSDSAICALWVNYGPKTDTSLSDYTVIVQEDFITKGEI